jgi:6,7-dimethyl-8-ribityllumazine synthase
MQKAQKTQNSPFDAGNWKIGVVVAQFNSHITNRSLESVLKRAKSYGIKDENVQIIEVAGCIEIPLALQKLAHSGRYKVLVAIGCVIRGETAHFDYVCQFVTEGILRVQLDQQIPIAFGVLTCENEQQALARTDLAGEHLDAVLHLAKSLERLENQK